MTLLYRYSLEGVGRLSGEYGESVWRMLVGCLDDVERQTGGCREVVWRWGGCLEGVER